MLSDFYNTFLSEIANQSKLAINLSYIKCASVYPVISEVVTSYLILCVLDIDAMGKPGAGIKFGNMAWLGSYSECKAIPGASYCLADISAKPQNVCKT